MAARAKPTIASHADVTLKLHFLGNAAADVPNAAAVVPQVLFAQVKHGMVRTRDFWRPGNQHA